jgi:3-phenylpropionate/cinnamic acid dioxygenase small subunit
VDDVEAIRSLLHAYASRLDAGDLDGVAALFAHATWRSAERPEPLRGVDAIRRVYDDVILYDGVPCTQHAVTNVSIVRSGSNVAASQCAFAVLQAVPGFPLQTILAGRYHDEFARVAGEWRFTDRLVLPDLVGDLSRHMRRAPAPP